MVQTTSVFANVSKGILAKHEDLQKVFGTTDEEKICRIILAEGELQAWLICLPEHAQKFQFLREMKR